MKKVILALAFVSTLAFVSCKESTEDKVEEAAEAVATEVETTTEDVIEVIDSTATEVGNDIEKEVEVMDHNVN